MFDFNHGALRKAIDPRSLPISQRINHVVDAGIVAHAEEEDAKKVRKYIGASQIGYHCMRSVQLDYLKATRKDFNKSPDKFPPKLRKIFENGHVIEDMVAGWLRRGGFKMNTIKADGKQYGFYVEKYNFRGHYDGIIEKTPCGLDAPCLWECKGLNNAGFNKIKKQGVFSSHPQYAIQIAVNQRFSKITAPCLLTIYNKNTSDLHHEMVLYSPRRAEEGYRRAKMIYRATNMGRLIQRPMTSPHNFICRECRWNEACWKFRR